MTATEIPWRPGLLTALVTPLTDDAVDFAGLTELLKRQVDAGVSGVVACGGTGEYGALSLTEREQLAEEVVRLAANRVPVIVQTGALATRDTLRLSRHAEKSGAAGLLVASPFGEPINWRERRSFYEQVSAAVDLPIMVYNTPPAGLLTFKQVTELAELPNVTAIKDSSGDATLLGDLLAWASAKDHFDVYVGADSLIDYGLASGASGVLLGVGNFLAPELVRLVELLRSGQATPERERLWREVRRLFRFMEGSSNYVGLVKLGCAAKGFDVGQVRSPYLMPSAAERETFAELVSSVEDAFTKPTS